MSTSCPAKQYIFPGNAVHATVQAYMPFIADQYKMKIEMTAEDEINMRDIVNRFYEENKDICVAKNGAEVVLANEWAIGGYDMKRRFQRRPLHRIRLKSPIVFMQNKRIVHMKLPAKTYVRCKLVLQGFVLENGIISPYIRATTIYAI